MDLSCRPVDQHAVSGEEVVTEQPLDRPAKVCAGGIEDGMHRCGRIPDLTRDPVLLSAPDAHGRSGVQERETTAAAADQHVSLTNYERPRRLGVIAGTVLLVRHSSLECHEVNHSAVLRECS